MQITQPNPDRHIELPNIHQIKKGLFKIAGGNVRAKYKSKLEKYYASGSLDDEQYHAGERLYNDAYHGGVLSAIKGMDYTKVRSSGGNYEMSWFAADMHKNFSKAMHSKEIGRVQREILWHIVIFDNDVSSFSENRMYAIGLLRETLNELARHYKG